MAEPTDLDLILSEAERLSATAEATASKPLRELRASQYASRIPSATPAVGELREAQEILTGPTGGLWNPVQTAYERGTQALNEPWAALEMAAEMFDLSQTPEERQAQMALTWRRQREEPLRSGAAEFMQEIQAPYPEASGFAAEVLNPFEVPLDRAVELGLIGFARLARKIKGLPDVLHEVARYSSELPDEQVDNFFTGIQDVRRVMNESDTGVRLFDADQIGYGSADDSRWVIQLPDRNNIDEPLGRIDFELRFDDSNEPYVYIYDIKTSPDARPREIQSAIAPGMATVLDLADATGLRVVTEAQAFAHKGMATHELAAMYNRLGFEVEDTGGLSLAEIAERAKAGGPGTFVPMTRRPMPIEQAAREYEQSLREIPEFQQHRASVERAAEARRRQVDPRDADEILSPYSQQQLFEAANALGVSMHHAPSIEEARRMSEWLGNN